MFWFILQIEIINFFKKILQVFKSTGMILILKHDTLGILELFMVISQIENIKFFNKMIDIAPSLQKYLNDIHLRTQHSENIGGVLVYITYRLYLLCVCLLEYLQISDGTSWKMLVRRN